MADMGGSANIIAAAWAAKIAEYIQKQIPANKEDSGEYPTQQIPLAHPEDKAGQDAG
ncbi:MAG: hypothetical protein M3H12_14530 [Chromatiales bacterium]|nr:hypothetical protein [Gammaproteobacteria bacterium]